MKFTLIIGVSAVLIGAFFYQNTDSPVALVEDEMPSIKSKHQSPKKINQDQIESNRLVAPTDAEAAYTEQTADCQSFESDNESCFAGEPAQDIFANDAFAANDQEQTYAVEEAGSSEVYEINSPEQEKETNEQNYASRSLASEEQ